MSAATETTAAPPIDVDRLGEISTQIEEALTRLAGVEQGLTLICNLDDPPEPDALLLLLRDQLRAEREGPHGLHAAFEALSEVWRAAVLVGLREKAGGGAEGAS